MGETALEFGPEWLRQLSHGSSTISPPPVPSVGMPVPVYSLAEFRYGREEMLAFFREDPKLPECLKEFPQLVFEKWQLPLALIPITEEEQRIWSRSVNSDAALRTSGKSGPGNGMSRTGRGGSVDRGRGRGRGSYYQRGLSFEDGDDGPPGGFSRPKPMERSQSANEKDQRWDDRDRRFDRTYSGRSGVLEDSNSLPKEGSRGPPDHWRKYDKEGGGEDWRSSTVRPSDKTGGRGSWRMNLERDRNNRDTVDRSLRSSHMNGMVRNPNHNPSKSSGGHSWDTETSGSNLPEWSVDESNETDIVGTFDSSGAFLEKKMAANASNEEIYISDDADEGNSKDSPEAKTSSTTTPKRPPPKQPQKSTNSNIHPNRLPPKQNTAPLPDQSTIHKEMPSPEKIPLEIKKAEPCTHQPQNSVKKLDPVPENVILPGTVKPPVAPGNSSNNKKNNKLLADCDPVTVPNVPDLAQKCTKNNNVVLSSVPPIVPETLEEDAFAHHKKATENMVAQWTEEEEHQVISQAADAFPLHQEDSNKWFYRDPQGEIQGPFTSPEMLEWFSAGYFTMGLMVRRGCDAAFSQLGELIKSWGRVPFMPGSSPPSIRVAPISANTTASSIPAPVSQTVVPSPVSAPPPAPQHLPKQQQDNQLRLLQQQIMQQQIVQQQLLIRQAQMQTILGQLKQQDNFANLNPQQQQQILMQQYVAQQQHSRPNIGPMGDQKNILESMTPLTLPVLGLPIPPLLKNDLPLWNVAPGTSGTWPLGMNPTQTPGSSIWDTDLPKSAEKSELKKQAQLLTEEQEKLRQAEDLRLEEERQREEQRKQQEELKRKQEEERLLKELQKKEEEKKKQEELRRQQEEERQRQEELRKIEEQRRKEEELCRIEEQKRLEELHRQEELRMQQEELCRQQEERRRQEEEQRKKEELKRQEELQKQEELKTKEELRKKEESRLKESQLMKELEREETLKWEREKQHEREEMELKKIQELKIKAQCPAWGMQNSKENSIELSLSDIQRIQEEKDQQEREEKMRQQILQQQQQNAKQVQQSNNSLNWAKRSTGSPAVKSIAEIQQEEAEKLAQMQRVQKPQMPPPTVAVNVGVWGNASHNRVTSMSQSWNTNYVATSGFWDDALNSTSARKPAKSNDSAFPALAINPAQPASANSNKNKNVRAKKEEDMVTRLFGTHRKPTDEFTQWCTEALSTLPSSVDVPTFVAFLKDVESPFEVYDYVKSYLGEGKEPREFAKQFLERRSKYRNQAKQMPAEENMWGPAPAITPLVNKPSVQHQHQSTNSDCDSSKGKSKKKKNRMQKLDNSMLGFTVQSNPDRINVGEIDHIEGI